MSSFENFISTINSLEDGTTVFSLDTTDFINKIKNSKYIDLDAKKETINSINQLLSTNFDELASKFSSSIAKPIFKQNDLVTFALPKDPIQVNADGNTCSPYYLIDSILPVLEYIGDTDLYIHDSYNRHGYYEVFSQMQQERK